ncbi:hypothetical protein FACUT_14185 [Fusarium acutatum]|uniref:SSCRP protein n=1 Tax=Fusarium acutatum TaxID=78861 RepID=A0A8H4JA03_9HYPO|nr:hypothetical protein FACUT_14185 [Fusarium acutatum]
MKFTALITSLALASSGLAAAIEKRTYDVVLYTCPVPAGQPPTPEAEMAKAYSYACIHSFGCQHSVAPVLVDREFIGDCLNCPMNIPQATDGCILVPQ